MLCLAVEHFEWNELLPMFREKCRVRDIKPDIKGLTSDNLKTLNKKVWKDRLGPMLKELPDFDLVWKDWTETFNKMTGKRN
jgi:hypothetical protein